ncbi:MGH1-like glycoside hydrolase domain-containing protein [Deminuibacter soli]|uniref:MGH1-like glycoside hydrolase domain-containing protein n=1 Tax=Deminuibacter soli TaxID=2291815 RepID=UPI001314AD51|nr:trehalase family glycosidase [Deminuibacter soli]
MKYYAVAFFIWGCLNLSIQAWAQQMPSAIKQYQQVQTKLARGWNTWNTGSVLSQVHLPEGLAIDLLLKDTQTGEYLKTALAGSPGVKLSLAKHSNTGDYTCLVLEWHKIRLKIQSATTGDDLVMQIEPLGPNSNGALIIEPHMLWGKGGVLLRKENLYLKEEEPSTAYAFIRSRRTGIYTTGITTPDSYQQQAAASLGKRADSPVTISTGVARTKEEINTILQRAEQRLQVEHDRYGADSAIYEAMQTVLNWNLVYDPSNNRVISPVSRYWSVSRGGYVLFCWDNYFAAWMLSEVDKAQAYANVVETTAIIDEAGFVPNHNGANDISYDRSQPPIGSMVVKRLYEKFHDKWLVELLFDRLLKWNRWWPKHRQNGTYLSWGSSPFAGMDSSIYKESPMQRAMWESGLDNSPMYDHVPFDSIKKHTMELADVGLLSLYIADCRALASLARTIGRQKEMHELTQRAQQYNKALETLWSEKDGIYLNKRTDNNTFSHRLSPTNFYPLLTGLTDKARAERMIKEHLMNTTEFWGDYIIPSIAKSDNAYKDNNYWRGRIWAPMNFLVYLGLCNYHVKNVRKEFISKSERLLLQSWIQERHIFENYNAQTGVGGDVTNSDPFYHWGALLGFMAIIEKDTKTIN